MASTSPFRSLLNRLLGRKPNTLPPFNFARNRYPAKKTWPPKLMELPKKRQFNFERRFKRRLLLKVTYTKWNKGVQVSTWVIISAVVFYSVFFYDFANDPWNPAPGEQPFIGLRTWTKEFFQTYFGFTTDDLDEAGERGARRDPMSSTEAYAKDTANAEKITVRPEVARGR